MTRSLRDQRPEGEADRLPLPDPSLYRRRTDAPGRLQHVIARAVHGDRLFPDDSWRDRFAGIFAIEAEEREWDVWSAVLMGTHYHVLLSTPDASLGAGLKRAHHRLAHGRNRDDDRRRGRVMGTRYKAIAIRDADHLAACLRYIPMNPVKAGLCRHPADWRWSTYPATIGRSPAPSWLRIDKVKEFLNSAFVGNTTEFLSEPLPPTWLPDPPLREQEWTRFDVELMLARGESAASVAARLRVSRRWVNHIAAGTPTINGAFRMP